MAYWSRAAFKHLHHDKTETEFMTRSTFHSVVAAVILKFQNKLEF